MIRLFLMRNFPRDSAIYGKHIDVHLRSLRTYPTFAIESRSSPVRDDGRCQADTSGDQGYFAHRETQLSLPGLSPRRNARAVRS
jgi:hypothetical protein